MAAIELAQISKSFGTTRVLNDIGLAVAAGEFLTLVGPSGCGKSTLLRILAGLEAPSLGRVSIDGRDVTGVRAADRNLAMVFQSYALYPHLSVADNMMTPLKLRDLKVRERLPLIGPLTARAKYRSLRGQVDETAAVLQIEHLLDRKPGQLSGGQRQRAALGRAMVRKPVAFLMDEPLSNLDAALRVHMRAELSELHRSLGTTFVYVTHDQAEALTMSDRMAVMMDGDILQLGPPDEVYNDPIDIRVAEFVGSPKINLIPAEADTDGRVTYNGIALDRSTQVASAGPVTVGLRPEHLSLYPARGEAALSGRVVHRENLGADIYLHIILDRTDTRIVVRATPQEAGKATVGEPVRVGRIRGEALVFDGQGKRLRLTVPAKTTAREVA